MKHHGQTLIVGIGSPHGDDQVGWEIAKQIPMKDSDRTCIRLARTPDDLLDWMDGVEQLLICDACQGASEVGSFHHWKWPSDQLQSIRWSGTHHVSLPAVLALAQQLGRLPATVHIWGVEIRNTQPGQSVSGPVLEGAVAVAKAIGKELSTPIETVEQQHA